MKTAASILVSILCVRLLAQTTPTEKERFFSPENAASYVEVIDSLIERGEALHESPSATARTKRDFLVSGDTANHLHLSFSVTEEKGVITYFFGVSRLEQGLAYPQAVTIAALFADRAGLPHTGQLAESEKHMFYAMWMVEAATWPEVKLAVLKTRAENRKEADPQLAFKAAFDKERAVREAQKRQKANQVTQPTPSGVADR